MNKYFNLLAFIALLTILPDIVALPQIAAATTHNEDSMTIPVNRISESGVGDRTGEIRLRQTEEALEVVVDLKAFPPGWHAMHVHEHPTCSPALQDGVIVAGGAAGMHYDPTGVMKMDNMPNAAFSEGDLNPTMPRDGKALAMLRPKNNKSMPNSQEEAASLSANRGRPRGDLPSIFVGESGTTRYRIVTYRLSLHELRGRSIMIHEYGEVPTDPTLPSGGGRRIACGVIQ